MNKFSCEESADSGELNLGGLLTIENSAAIHKALREALKRSDTVVINLGSCSEADVTFFQILCAAHRTALRENKKLIIKNLLQAPVVSCLEDAGFRRDKGCSHDREGSCLWTGGKGD